ncbi:unnamed protein product [Effrenium voratum]|nr:unnamed protein product [Effrenium voratum]
MGRAAQPASRFLAERTKEVGALARAQRWQLAVFLALVETPAEIRDSRLLAAALGALGKGFKWREALALLPRRPEASSSNAVLGACKRARCWAVALRLWEATPAPDLFTFNTAIALCSVAPPELAADAAGSLLANLHASACQPDAVTFNSLAKAFSHANHWRAASHVAFELNPEVSLPGATAASAACWRNSLLVLPVLRHHGGRPDVMMYNAISGSCSSSTQWRLAVQVLHDQCLCERSHPDIVCYNVAITACGRSQASVKGLLPELRALRLVPNRVTMNSLLSGCDGAGDWEESIELLARFVGESLESDAVTLTALLGACSRAARWREAAGFWQKSKAEGGPSDARAESVAVLGAAKGFQWNSALLGLSERGAAVSDWMGHWEQALELYRGTSASVDFSNTVISACSAAWRFALRLFYAARKRRLVDQVSYAAAMNACSAARLWLEALSLLRASQHLTASAWGGYHYRVETDDGMRACEEGGAWRSCQQLLTDLLQAVGCQLKGKPKGGPQLVLF